MMKKLLTLVLVLGIASIASASYTLSGGEKTASISGAGNGLVNQAFYLVFSGTTVTETTWTYGGTAKAFDIQTDVDVLGALVDLVKPAAMTQGYMVNFADFAGTASQNGLLISFSTAGAGKVFMISDAGDAVVGSADITAVPEPITMTLLGLGGLFLARRKN